MADAAPEASGPNAPPPSAAARYGFAVGDFGFNLYWQGLGLFLIYFQTDVLGLPAAWAGAGYLVASLWDGLSDPVVGALADRTRSHWGRYRPYLLFGSVPLALAFALVFSAPPLAGPALFAATLGAQLLVRALYTALAIPYASLSVVITRDAEQRTRLTGLRMQCAYLGGVAVAYLMPALAAFFAADPARPAYGAAALAIGALATLAFLLCFACVREPPEAPGPRPTPAPLFEDGRAFLRAARGNGPLLRLLLAKALVVFTLTLQSRNTVYYFKYALGALDAVRYAMPLLTAASLLAVPAWVWVIRRAGQRGAWRAACLATALFALGLQLPLGLPLALALLAAVAAATTAFAVCFWAMLPDTVEYHEWRSGRRDEAKVFGIASFTQKVAMGLSALAGGLLLDASGFAANQAQGPAALQALRWTMGLAPALGALLSWRVMRDYALDGVQQRRIVEALRARQVDSSTIRSV